MKSTISMQMLVVHNTSVDHLMMMAFGCQKRYAVLELA